MSEALGQIALAGGTEMVKQTIGHILATWVKPKLEEYRIRRSINDKLEQYLFDVFSKYLTTTYNVYKTVNILALSNQQIDIEHIYLPLTISSHEKKESILIDQYHEEFSGKYKKIVIEVEAGMGKSTIMRKLFVSAIEKNSGIPIFVEMKKLKKDKSVIDIIIDQVNSLTEVHQKEFIHDVIVRGGFIFFFDGFDEVALDHKEEIISDLKKFISDASENIFYLTSRPNDALSSFGDFQKFRIKSLNIEESYELIRKYDNVTGLEISSKLIKNIEECIDKDEFSDLTSFLENPLLVSLLYLTYKYKRDIPERKIQFYRKVYDALFDEHDSSKDGYKRTKQSGLASEQLHGVLRKLGYLCMRNNENEYTKDNLMKLIRESIDKPYYGNIHEGDVFDDIVDNVPLFVRVGLDYKWAHKSFMEYFAAHFIYMDKGKQKEEIISNIWLSKNLGNYFGMLDFYYEVDRETFDKTILLPVINDYLTFFSEEVGDNEKRYRELIYNKSIYFTRSEALLRKLDNDNTSEKEDNFKIFQQFAANEIANIFDVAQIEFNGISISIRRGLGEGGIGKPISFTSIYVSQHKVDSLIKMLSSKNNYIISELKGVERKPEDPEIQIYSCYEIWKNIKFEPISSERVQNLVKFLLSEGETVYIDYRKAMKYKRELDSMANKNDDYLFLDL